VQASATSTRLIEVDPRAAPNPPAPDAAFRGCGRVVAPLREHLAGGPPGDRAPHGVPRARRGPRRGRRDAPARARRAGVSFLRADPWGSKLARDRRPRHVPLPALRPRTKVGSGLPTPARRPHPRLRGAPPVHGESFPPVGSAIPARAQAFAPGL